MAVLKKQESNPDSPYRFIFTLKTEPAYLTIGSYRHTLYKEIRLRDSIFEPYPLMTISFNDDEGFFIENRFFIEGLKYKINFTDIENEQTKQHRLFHDFYQVYSRVDDPLSKNSLSGVVTFSYKSYFLFQSGEKTRTFMGNINNVVTNIVSNYAYPSEFLKQRIYVSNTENNNTYYQLEQDDYTFLKNLAEVSYSTEYPNSPFIWFFNLNSEFRFMPVVELLTQSPVASLTYGEDRANTTYFAKGTLENYTIQNLGLTKTKFSYKRRSSKLCDTSAYLLSDKTINDKSRLISNTNKIPILKQNVNDYDGVASYYGIVNSLDENNEFLGWENSKYKGYNEFPFRMSFDTTFSPELVSGRTVNLKFFSKFKDKNYTVTEYSGRWLILESTHTTNSEGDAFTTLEVGRNEMGVDRENSFYRDFIK